MKSIKYYYRIHISFLGVAAPKYEFALRGGATAVKQPPERWFQA
ncbi:hypothetical protein ACF3DV_01005 [Chlorogloeopsis fritschii PCC 9212]|nr:hypothetical protein [Chlorogloeopsis fritschii]